ncbi:MAG: phasin family protein, partial [Pseudomonadota bacterium]
VAGSVEKISSEQAEFTKSSVEDGMKTVKAMAAAICPQDDDKSPRARHASHDFPQCIGLATL